MKERKKFHIDLTGQKFGQLTVFSYNKTEKSFTFWNCKCDCGTEYIVRGYSLKTGYTTRCRSCACIGIHLTQREGTKDISGQLISFVRNSARRRAHEFNISKELLQSILEKQEFKCALSKVPIFVGHIEKKDRKNIKWSGSLDRIDSSKGYIEGNVQWLHKDVNWMKQDYSQEEFIQYCKLIAKNN
jgi:hypothetical protein